MTGLLKTSAIIYGLSLLITGGSQASDLEEDAKICATLHNEHVRMACFEAVNSQIAGQQIEEATAPPPLADKAFGEEHLQRQRTKSDENLPQEDAFLSAKVLRAEKDRRKIWTFYLGNGQVWRQNEPDFISVPKTREFSITIRKGTVGDYRLRIEGKGRMTRVRRLR